MSLLFEIGEHPRVKRLFRFFWKRRPAFPRYRITWDLTKVLNFLKSWHPPSSLSDKKLTLKTLFLTAATSSDRAQSLQAMDVEHSEMNHEGIFFPIYSLLKNSQRNKPVRVVKCIKFDIPSLDVSNYIIHYMQRSFKHRVKAVQDGLPKPRQLFLSYSTGKPLRRASISQYLLEVLSLAGINTSTFKAHSTRGALPSIMSARGASPHVILNHGDWRNLGTFKKFYDRHSDSSIEGRLIRQVTRNSGT